MNNIVQKLLTLIFVISIVSCGGSKYIDQAEEIEQTVDAVKNRVETAKKPIKKSPKQEKKISPIQRKYASIMEIPPTAIKNIELFKFIDEWIEVPYRMGGETKNGIDCSFFSQYLFHDVYGNLIERTAQKQYNAPSTDKFLGQEFLREGDLLFFNLEGSEHYPITHVGVYLGHHKFVHSTSRRDSNGYNGVQISDFRKKHWQKMFVAAGRKPKLTRTVKK